MRNRYKRRKFIYQNGGIIPQMQGAQIFANQNRPIAQEVRPIGLDPSSAFAALNSREANKRTAISLGNLNRAERQDAWRKELDQRNFLERRMEILRNQRREGMDSITALDLNDPNQYQMARDMRRQIEEYTKQGQEILTNNSLSSAERMARLSELDNGLQSIMSDPDYLRNVQANTLAGRMHEQIEEAMLTDDFIDYDKVERNLALTQQYQSGEITRGQYLSRIENFTVPIDEINGIETKLDTMITDAFDPDKMAQTWEKYSDDPDFLQWTKKAYGGTIDDVVTASMDYVRNHQHYDKWKMEMERRGRFVDDSGAFDETLFENYLYDKAQLADRSIAAARGADGSIITDRYSQQRPAGAYRTSGTSGTKLSDAERRMVRAVEGINGTTFEQDGKKYEYEVIDPDFFDPRNIDDELVPNRSSRGILNFINSDLGDFGGKLIEGDPNENQAYKRGLYIEDEDGNLWGFPSTDTYETAQRKMNLRNQMRENIRVNEVGATNNNNATTNPFMGATEPNIAPSGSGTSFQQAIDAQESQGDYNALYGFSNREGGAFEGTNVSQMTLGQLKEFSDPNGEYAAWSEEEVGRVATPMGRYQVTGKTLRDAQQALGLDDNTVFTPEVQDAIGEFLYDRRLNRANTEGFKDSDGNVIHAPGTKEAKRAQLRAEWEGFENMDDAELDAMIEAYEQGDESIVELAENPPQPTKGQVAQAEVSKQIPMNQIERYDREIAKLKNQPENSFGETPNNTRAIKRLEKKKRRLIDDTREEIADRIQRARATGDAMQIINNAQPLDIINVSDFFTDSNVKNYDGEYEWNHTLVQKSQSQPPTYRIVKGVKSGGRYGTNNPNMYTFGKEMSEEEFMEYLNDKDIGLRYRRIPEEEIVSDDMVMQELDRIAAREVEEARKAEQEMNEKQAKYQAMQQSTLSKYTSG